MQQQGLKPNVITYIAPGAGFWTWPPQGSQELDTFAESWVIAGKGQSGSEKGQSGSETVDRKVRRSESTGVLKAKEAWCEVPVCDPGYQGSRKRQRGLGNLMQVKAKRMRKFYTFPAETRAQCNHLHCGRQCMRKVQDAGEGIASFR